MKRVMCIIQSWKNRFGNINQPSNAPVFMEKYYVIKEFFHEEVNGHTYLMYILEGIPGNAWHSECFVTVEDDNIEEEVIAESEKLFF